MVDATAGVVRRVFMDKEIQEVRMVNASQIIAFAQELNTPVKVSVAIALAVVLMAIYVPIVVLLFQQPSVSDTGAPHGTPSGPAHARSVPPARNTIGNIDGNKGVITEGQTGNNKLERP